MATINYTVNAIDAASGVFKRIAASADGLDTQLSDLSKRVATPAVDLNDAKFTVGIINAAKRLDKLNAMVANPEVEVDTAKAQLEILRINAMLDRLGKSRTTVEVDVKTDTGGLLGSLGRGAGGALGALIPGLGNTIGSLPALLGGGGSTGLAAIATSLGAIAASATAMAAVVGAAFAAVSFAAQAVAGVITFGLGAALAGIAILGASKAKSVKDSFADLAAQANKELVTIGKPFVPVLNSLVSTTRNIMRAMTPVFTEASKIIAGPFKLFADTLVKAFGQPAVKTSIEAVATAFAKLLNALTPQIPRDMQAIADAITNIANAVAKNPKAFADFVQFLVDIGKWSLVALGWLTQVAVYIEKHFVPALRDATGNIDTFGKSSKAFTAFGFTAQSGLAGSAAATSGLSATLNLFSKAAQATMKLAAGAFTLFARVAVSETKTVVGFFRNDVPAAFDGMRHGIANTFDGIRHDIADAFHAIANTFDQFRAFQGQTGAFEKDIAFAWDHIHAMTVQTWDAIRHYLASVLDAIRNSIATEFDNMRHDISAIFDNIRHDISAAWDSIWKTSQSQTKTGIGGIVGFFMAMPGRILRALGGLGTDLYNFGRMIWDKFWNGMQSIVPNILDWVGHFVSSIWDKVKKFFGLGSPSKLFYEAGMNLMIGLENGIKDHGRKAVSAAQGVAHQVSSAGAGVQRWAGLVRKALAMEGLSPSLLGNVLYQMQTESGGNPNAINLSDSNAAAGDPSRGLMQVIMSTFGEYHWPGTSNNIYNPLANIAAALNYARHVYGPSLMSGGMGIGSGHGYDQGGWLMPGRTLAINNTGRPERVLPPGGDVQRVVLEVRAGNSSAYSKFLVDELQKYIRVAGGGDVQVALGG